jgi:hypothetical protein
VPPALYLGASRRPDDELDTDVFFFTHANWCGYVRKANAWAMAVL